MESVFTWIEKFYYGRLRLNIMLDKIWQLIIVLFFKNYIKKVGCHSYNVIVI